MDTESAFAKASRDLKGRIMFITSTYGANSAQKHLVELLGLTKSDLPAMYVLTPTEYGATKYKYNGPPANASEE